MRTSFGAVFQKDSATPCAGLVSETDTKPCQGALSNLLCSEFAEWREKIIGGERQTLVEKAEFHFGRFDYIFTSTISDIRYC